MSPHTSRCSTQGCERFINDDGNTIPMCAQCLKAYYSAVGASANLAEPTVRALAENKKLAADLDTANATIATLRAAQCEAADQVRADDKRIHDRQVIELNARHGDAINNLRAQLEATQSALWAAEARLQAMRARLIIAWGSAAVCAMCAVVMAVAR